MSQSTILTIAVVLIVVGDLILVPMIIHSMTRSAWRPLMERYPPVEPGDEAVSRNFQSFRFGLLNLGLSVHVTVDDHALHLRQAKIIRWAGAREVSIPWTEIELVKLGRRQSTANIAGATVIGPTWCLSIAGGESAE